MKLLKVSISEMYESLSTVVDFNSELTLLVGRNGSGKTTILNVIEWLLKPDIRKLAIVPFKKIELEFTSEKHLHKAIATKGNGVLTIALECAGKAFKPIKVRLNENDGYADANDARYSNLSPEKDEVPLFKYFRDLPKPIIISLDRSISIDTIDDYLTNKNLGKEIKRVPPIRRVMMATYEKYSEYRKSVIKLDNELKARIVLAALQKPQIRNSRDKILNASQMDELETKVIKYLSASIKTENVSEHVKSYFKASKALATQIETNAKSRISHLSLISSQYSRIDSLAKAFKQFESDCASEFREINNYITSINKFFSDSEKCFDFDESSNQLYYYNTYDESKKAYSLSALSSGEKQILILFTYLAFISKEGGVFIVDEPELSLHPKWQAEFVEQFMVIRPKNSQVLMATHSPDIVGKSKSFCKVVKRK